MPCERSADSGQSAAARCAVAGAKRAGADDLSRLKTKRPKDAPPRGMCVLQGTLRRAFLVSGRMRALPAYSRITKLVLELPVSGQYSLQHKNGLLKCTPPAYILSDFADIISRALLLEMS